MKYCFGFYGFMHSAVHRFALLHLLSSSYSLHCNSLLVNKVFNSCAHCILNELSRLLNLDVIQYCDHWLLLHLIFYKYSTVLYCATNTGLSSDVLLWISSIKSVVPKLFFLFSKVNVADSRPYLLLAWVYKLHLLKYSTIRCICLYLCSIQEVNRRAVRPDVTNQEWSTECITSTT